MFGSYRILNLIDLFFQAGSLCGLSATMLNTLLFCKRLSPRVEINTVLVGLLPVNNHEMSRWQRWPIIATEMDNQIGLVTRKVMEQGYHTTVAICMAILGFAFKDIVLMWRWLALPPTILHSLYLRLETFSDSPTTLSRSFSHGSVIPTQTHPFIHVTLVFMQYRSRDPGSIIYLEDESLWDLLGTMFTQHGTRCSSWFTNRIEDESFPKTKRDDVRPFPEDFAIRGLLWTDTLQTSVCGYRQARKFISSISNSM